MNSCITYSHQKRILVLLFLYFESISLNIDGDVAVIYYYAIKIKINHSATKQTQTRNVLKSLWTYLPYHIFNYSFNYQYSNNRTSKYFCNRKNFQKKGLIKSYLKHISNLQASNVILELLIHLLCVFLHFWRKWSKNLPHDFNVAIYLNNPANI